ncbi:MAG: cation transporting ATPase C-terminal domain-containing protein, partial [Candidatus Caccovivens sp.]
FSPALILYINFVSDTFVGLALGFEKAEPDVMKKKPIKHRGNLFKGDVGFNIFASGLFVSVNLIMLYCLTTFVWNLTSAETTTICFIYICFVELFHAYNLKSQTASLFSSNPFDNKVLNWSFLGSAFLTVLVVLLPIAPLQTAMGIVNINWWQWLLAIGTAILVIPYFEIVKLLIRYKHKRKEHGKQK